MTCVIKKSLFTHQKPRHSEAESAWQNVFTHQEINNLSYVLLSHLHRSLIALPRRHTPAWLYEKGAKQRNIQKGKREVSAGAAAKTYLIHREGWIHQHFLELNLSILLICKEWVKFCPRQKKKILSQSFSWTIGTLKVHETRVSISVLWKQKMELSLVCKELSVNDGSECTHTLPRPSLLGPKTWQLQCDFLRESKLPLAERVTLTAAFPNVRTSRNYSGM